MGGWESLWLSIGWRNAKNAEKSQDALKRAIELLAKGSSEQQIVAGWLRDPPADFAGLVPKLTDLSLEPDDKVIVLLALAGTGHPGSDKLLELAKRLNAWPNGCKDFVDVTLAAMQK